jgi:hypothetical protein
MQLYFSKFEISEKMGKINSANNSLSNATMLSPCMDWAIKK